jgi:hypothetical protein
MACLPSYLRSCNAGHPPRCPSSRPHSHPDQDERLTLLSHSINRQNDLSIQIGDELDRHHELLEDTDAAMDRTAARLQRARRRLDTVADGARQHGESRVERNETLA